MLAVSILDHHEVNFPLDLKPVVMLEWRHDGERDPCRLDEEEGEFWRLRAQITRLEELTESSRRMNPARDEQELVASLGRPIRPPA